MLNYFDFEEFDSPDEVGSGLPKSQGGEMDISFLHKIDEARNIADVPFKINSGYRSEAWNTKCGGRLGSSHRIGVACDIHCNNSSNRSAIVRGLMLAGFTRIGIAKTFIHADTDQNKPDAIWLYQ